MENMSKTATFALDEVTPTLKTQFGARRGRGVSNLRQSPSGKREDTED